MNSHDASSGQEVSFAKVIILTFLSIIFSLSEGHAGTALRLYYQNIKGDAVADLFSHPSFPSSPSGMEVISTGLERIERGGDNWGSWTRGYLEAPQTGKYTFFLASDNNSELWLSTTYLPFHLVKMMENTNVLSPQDYKVRSDQIDLAQGGKYYFELYHKEGIGSDHISIGWKMPNGISELPIPSHRVMPVPVDKTFQTQEKAPVFLTQYFSRPVSAVTNVKVFEGETVMLAATVEGSQPMTFQWFKNEKLLAEENLSSLTLSNLQLSQSGEKFLVIASNEFGTASSQAIVTVVRDDTDLMIRSALNLGISNKIAVIFSKAINPASASVLSSYELNNGATVKSVKVVSRDTIHLTASPLRIGKTYTVKARNVKDLVQRSVITEQKPFEVDHALSLWLQFDAKDEHDVVPDSSGNYNSAVLLNGARLNRGGVLGSCLELDGVDDHAILPSGFASFPHGMTVALWAKPMSNGFWCRFIDFGNGHGQQNILFAREERSNHLAFESYGATLKKVIARDVLGQNEWQHLAASMDARGKVSLYKNGVLVGEASTNIPASKQRTRNLIGRSNWNGDAFYKGFMDDLRVYERALSAAEIQVLANADSLQRVRK